ncbi:MAG: HAD family hydrolase [Thermoplasmatota archaeon]
MEVDSRKASETLKRAGHVIFDFDGTLFQIDVDWVDLKRTLYKTAEEMGLPGKFGSLRELYALSSGHPQIKRELIDIQTEFELRGRGGAVGIDQGITAARWRLSRGLMCSLCSSNTRSTLMEMVGDWGFHPVVALDDVSNPKPDPEGILRIIGETGMSREDVVMLGNTEFDSEAADKAGISFIDVLNIEERWFE